MKIHELRDDLEDLEIWQMWLNAADWLCFDLETQSNRSNLADWHPHSRVVSASFTREDDEALVVPLSHPHAASFPLDHIELGRALFASLGGAKLVGHNLKYDVRWVGSTLGVDLARYMAWDTRIAASLENENRSLSLKDVAVEELGVDRWEEDVDLSDPEGVPWDDMRLYNALDTIYTWRLHLLQRERLRSRKRLGRQIWHVLRPSSSALCAIEWEGMLLDLDRVAAKRDDYEQRHSELYVELEAQTPAKIRERHQDTSPRLFEVDATDSEKLSWAPTSKFFRDYAETRWPTLGCSERCECQRGDEDHPVPSWNASVLGRLAAQGYRDAELLLQYRKLDKVLSTYLRPWPGEVDERSRLHPTYNQANTVTGRLSCNGPNLQQVPSHGELSVKDCFIAPPGDVFMQVDFSQIEVRIMAQVSGDEDLLDVYREGRDVYVETAGAAYGVDVGDGTKAIPGGVTGEMRQKTKAVVLGFLYRMSPAGFVAYARDAYGLTFTEDEAAAFQQALFDRFPGIPAYHERMARLAHRDKQVTYPSGRIRRVPHIDSDDSYERGKAERQAINSPIQGTASDIMQLALAQIHQQVPRTLARLCGSVHDSALLYVPKPRVYEAVDLIAPLMLEPDPAALGFELEVPLSVEFEIGPSWGEVDEEIERVGGGAGLCTAA